MKIAVIGTILGIANLAVTYSVWKSGSENWQTIGLLTVVLLQIVAACASRAGSVPVFKVYPVFKEHINPWQFGRIF